MYITNTNPWQSSSFPTQSFLPLQSAFSSIQPWQTSSFVQAYPNSQFSPQAQGYNVPLQTGAVSITPWSNSFQMGGIIPQVPISYASFNPNIGWQQGSNAMMGQINPQISSSMMHQQMGISSGIRSSSGMAQPRVELAETNSDVIVTAELPNVDPNNIYLTVTDDSLSISALSQMSGMSSSLHRTVALPTSVKSEHLDVSYSNGTLECRLPKSDFSARRRVKVNVTG
ncbi:Hsp20/alpha crystallin family protein [Candidatus Contubernalis alkaliaceticus]|uniref:Hsp20/alpha crystallin family protein n=1 Tax=Candidatus Contubernalis alkaliaceticus TaxID=338645 RepID=UPI001F4C44FD|nr:Hsp20/alpha crystallin family protein [Candidatus Contubernalis alkalaceticus]UNC91930.1 Hsp20 family protein [Candidatus Contubernalis alkalaceticus]